MEFTKREIKRPDPKPIVEDKKKEEPKVEEKKGCATCGKQNEQTPRPSAPTLTHQRFIVAAIKSEMFEYSDIRRAIVSSGHQIHESTYDQVNRQSVFSFPSGQDGAKLMEDLSMSVSNLGKVPRFSMKTLSVPPTQSEEDSV